MSGDSGLPFSLEGDSDQRGRTTYEPGGHAFTPCNKEGDYFITSDREAAAAAEDVSFEEAESILQSPAIQLIPPVLRLGGEDSRMGAPPGPHVPSGESEEHPMQLQVGTEFRNSPASSIQPTYKPAPPLKSKSTPYFSTQDPAPPLHHSVSYPETTSGGPARAGPGPSVGTSPFHIHEAQERNETTRFEVNDGSPGFYVGPVVTETPRPNLPPDADLAWRGIPDGLGMFDEDDETALKTEFREEERVVQPAVKIYTAVDCNECIGSLLDNTGHRGIHRKQKQSILNALMPRSSPFPAKTIIGLSEASLPTLTHDDLQHICATHNPGDLHTTCVHVLVNEMKMVGRRLGHLVEYFWPDDSKRVDILKTVREIHHGCPFCDSILSQLLQN